MAGESFAARGVESAPESYPSLFKPIEEPRLVILRCIRPEDGAGDGMDNCSGAVPAKELLFFAQSKFGIYSKTASIDNFLTLNLAVQFLLDVRLAGHGPLGPLRRREQFLRLDVLFLRIRAGGTVPRQPLHLFLQIRIRGSVRMPQTRDVAIAKFAAVPSGAGYVRNAVRVPVGGSGGPRHALTTIVADLFLIRLAGYVSRLAVDAAVVARVVVEHHVRQGQGLTSRRRTEDGGGCNLSCVNFILNVVHT